MTNRNIRLQKPIDFSRLIKPALRYWYLIVLSIFVAVLAALYYLKRTVPIYEVQTTILIRNNEEEGLTKDALQKEILGMGTASKIYEDARILRSHSLLEAIVDSLNLQYRLLKEGQYGEVDLYSNNPLDMSTMIAPQLPKSYGLRILDRFNYQLQLSEENQTRGIFGVPLNTDDGTFLLELKEERIANLDTTANYILRTNSVVGARGYLGSFAVSYNANQPTILDLFFRDNVAQRGIVGFNCFI